MTYRPALHFDRTPLERADPIESWKRTDEAFFMAGACHILAFMFMQLKGEGYHVVHAKPRDGRLGSHVYVSDGTWAFDAQGWTRESELMETTEAAYRAKYPGWACDRTVIAKDSWWRGEFEAWCEANYHRTPAYFAHLPWERAHNYILQIGDRPD